MVLGALAALLGIEDDIVVVGQAHNGQQALDAVASEKPDVLITDIEMPEISGLDVAAELKRQRSSTRTIILTTFARAGYLRRALDAGAAGYLLKDKPAKELADAVRRVHQGLRVIDPELVAEAWGEADPLPIGNGKWFVWRVRAWPVSILRRSWDCRRERCGITYRRP